MPLVLISGGTGVIGTNLTRHLTERGYEVIILTRDESKTSENKKIRYSYWNIDKETIDAEVIKKADHIIHLAGAGVMDKKWTEEYKRVILTSRTKSTQLLTKVLKENEQHVISFVSASAIGWYGEDSKPLIRKGGFIETDSPEKDFLGQICVSWEAGCQAVTTLGIRLVKLRTGIVLSNDGGTFKEFKTPVRFGVATILGNGKQIISWIHVDDLCRMYIEALERDDLHGSYNAVAPAPVSQKTLILTLSDKIKHKFYTPVHVPSVILKWRYGKRSIEILKSTTVNNQKIKAAGFTFLYPTIEAAVNELCDP